MATAKLVLDKRRKDTKLIDVNANIDNNIYPLRIRIYKGTENKEITLPYKFKVNEWIESENRVVKSYPNSGRVNSAIQQRYSIVTTTLSYFSELIENMDMESIRKLVCKEIEKGISNYLEDDTKKIVDSSLTTDESNLWLGKFAAIISERTLRKGKSGTAKWYDDAVAAIIKFNSKKDILIAKIDVKFLEEFETHHLSIGNSVNCIDVYLRAIRSITNKAIKEVLKGKTFENYPWGRTGFIIKTEKTKKRAVKREVIDDIRSLNVESHTAKWDAKNYLLFMFNNRGINLIDIAKLRKEQIVDSLYQNGKLIEGRLEYKRSKTGKDFLIRLTKESISILNSYNIAEQNEKDFVFPIKYVESKTGRATYNQNRKRINARFNELAADAGHEGTNMTTYVVRHTWGTEAKKKGLTLMQIQELFGHEDARTTQTYTDYFENSELDEMNEKILA